MVKKIKHDNTLGMKRGLMDRLMSRAYESLCPICRQPFTRLRPIFRLKWQGKEVHCRCYCEKLAEKLKKG